MGRWSDFEQMIEDNEDGENFKVFVFRSLSTTDEYGEEVEVYSQTESSQPYVAMWLYPEEQATVQIEGTPTVVEAIFITNPRAQVFLKDILVDTRDSSYHRVIGINDLKSHLEIYTSRILKPISLPNFNPGYSTLIGFVLA